jgi:hypothetical protein
VGQQRIAGVDREVVRRPGIEPADDGSAFEQLAPRSSGGIMMSHSTTSNGGSAAIRASASVARLTDHGVVDAEGPAQRLGDHRLVVDH